MSEAKGTNSNIFENKYFQYLILAVLGFFASSVLETKYFVTSESAKQETSSKMVSNFEVQILERLLKLEIANQNREVRDAETSKVLNQIQESLIQIEEGRAIIVQDRITKQEATELIGIQAKRIDDLKNDVMELKFLHR